MLKTVVSEAAGSEDCEAYRRYVEWSERLRTKLAAFFSMLPYM